MISTPRSAPKQIPNTLSVPDKPVFHQLAYHIVHDSANDERHDKQRRNSNPISNPFILKARKPDRQVSVVMAGDIKRATPRD